MGMDAFQRRRVPVEKLRPVSGRIQKPKPGVSAKTLKTTVREKLVQKFTSGQKSVLQQLGFLCRSVEDLKVDNFDDEILLLLRQELQNPSTKGNSNLRSAVVKARFADTINKRVSDGNAAEPSRKRKRVDDSLESERKKRREEEELRSLQAIQLRLKAEKQEREDCVETIERRQILLGHSGSVTSVISLHHNLVSCSLDGAIKARAAASDGMFEIKDTRTEKCGLLSLCWIHDLEGKPVLLCSCNDSTVRAYDIPTFAERGKICSEREVGCIQLGPTGMVFTGDAAGQVKVWKSLAPDVKIIV